MGAMDTDSEFLSYEFESEEEKEEKSYHSLQYI